MSTRPESQRLLDGYLGSLRARGLAEATLASRAQSIGCFLSQLEEKMDLRAVTRADMLNYAQALLSSRLTVGTASVHLVALRSFFAWLEETDAVLVNPCAGLPLPKLPKRLPRRVLTPSEVKRILAQPDVTKAQGQRDRAMLELLYSTGLRRAEVTALTVHDVDLNGGFVRVNRGKGGRGRITPLGMDAVAALRDYLEVRRTWLQIRGQWETALWLSPIKPHQPLKTQAVALVVRRCATRAGVKNASSHAWRHTCATHLVRGGAGIVYVQKLLGHRRLHTTEIYTRVSAGDLQQAVRRTHPRP
ncbi:MAG: tyrosine-type recombinase/integrase [Opitutales bacterium]|jgi:integrase/recombinase XerD